MTVGAGTDRVATRAAQDWGAEHLRELLVADRFTTSSAAVGLLLLMLISGYRFWMLVLIVLIIAMGLLRQLGMRPLQRGHTDRAVFWFAAGSWGVSVGAVLIVPISLPIVVITVAIPAVLAAMYQGDRQVRLLTAGLALVSALMGAISRWTEGAGLEDDLHPDLASAVLVLFLAVQSLPLVIAVRQASVQYRLSLQQAVAANESSKQAEHEVARSRARLAQAADAERRKIERDLHDGAQQLFVSSLVQLRVFDERVKRGRETNPGGLSVIADDLEDAIDELRRLARGIYPSLLQTSGLYEALQRLARTSSATTFIADTNPGRLPHEVETAAYFFASEALQNVAKHGGAECTAELRLQAEGESITLQICDDGVGLTDEATLGETRGIVNMHDRIAAVGGTVKFTQTPGGGCTVTAQVPALRTRNDAAGQLIERA